MDEDDAVVETGAVVNKVLLVVAGTDVACELLENDVLILVVVEGVVAAVVA